MKKMFSAFLAIIMVIVLASCASTDPTVKRLSENADIDLSGYWNDTDIRQVCASLIDSCTSGGWIRTYTSAKPAVRIGKIINSSSEHIDTQIIASKIEEALLNGGRVKFVADSSTIEGIRTEQEQQQYHAAKPVELAAETGADFILQGSVRTNLDQIQGKAVRTYYVSLELVNVQSAEKVWVGSDTVKKYIERSKYSL